LAIVQISRITNRKGRAENLPQLAGAEFGWSTDTRQLFIGNGTLEDGAPVIGNTEILTEFSDILAFQTNYTYKGEAAGYVVQTGPTPSTPISQSLQSWLDQFASVTDFGATGDGVTDDTNAINRALYQLFCREVNPQIRRSLYFPAGVYRITDPILIPPYATLYGEGANNSVIQLDSAGDSTLNECVARTADSRQQTGVNIGTNGATPPTYITVLNMGFESLDGSIDIFLVQNATNCRFQNVNFFGPLTTADLITDADDTRGIAFDSTTQLVCEQIVFDACQFGGTTYAIETDEQVKGVTVTNSKLDTHFQGVVLGSGTVINGGATGVRMTSNLFDNIYNNGIYLGDVELNVSANNIFYDVANHFQGTTNPAAAVINILSDNNASVGDMFERSDIYAQTQPRVNINSSTSFGMNNTNNVRFGAYSLFNGVTTSLADNTASPTTVITLAQASFTVEYRIVRGTALRRGSITVDFNPAGSNLTYTEDYTENASTGVTLSVVQVGTNAVIQYVTTSTGQAATFNYSTNLFS
jgi:Pectate lyase superfamily protein